MRSERGEKPLQASRLWPVAVVAVAALGVAGWWVSTSSPPGGMLDRGGGASVSSVRVAEVIDAEGQAPTVRATVRAAEAIAVPSPRRGAVESIEVESGARVEQGDLLLRMEQSSQQAELMAARSEVSQAEDILERAQARVEEGLTNEQTVEDMRARLETAQNELEAAERAVEAYNIRAPFAGRVTMAELEPGEIVSAGQPLAEISSERERVVRFEAPRRQVADLTIGDELEVHGGTGDDAVTGRAVIAALTATPGAETPMTAVVARLTSGAEALAPSETVTVRLPEEDADLVLVPEAALADEATGTRVFRIDRGFARATPVQVSERRDDGLVRVRGSLAPGDTVAVSGLETLQDGMRVEVTATVPLEEARAGPSREVA